MCEPCLNFDSDKPTVRKEKKKAKLFLSHLTIFQKKAQEYLQEYKNIQYPLT